MLNFFKSILFIVSIFIGGLIAFAQPQPIFQRIDQSQGLSSSRITGIVKEEEGFVWISTQNGLNRYDGYSFKIYNKQNSNIPTNDLSGLYLDRKKRLWLSTYGRGLILYNRQADEFVVYKHDKDNPNSIISNRINTIAEDASGELWVGTEMGLSFFDFENNTFHNYVYNEKNPLNVTSIFEDSHRRLWVGTSSNGLFLFNKQTKQWIDVDQNIPSAINAITQLNSDKILMATSGNGLLNLDLKENKVYNFFQNQDKLAQQTKIVRSMMKDSKGNLWIGTDGFGLFELIKPNSKIPEVKNYMQNAQQSFSLSGNAIYSLTEDDENNIWIGTAWNGINVLNSKKQTEIIFSDFAGVSPSPVLSIFQNEKYLFLGLDGNGMSMYDKVNNTSSFFDEQVLQAKYIQNITQTQDGKLWLGTFNNGLIKFDLDQKTTQKYVRNPDNQNSLSFNDVRDIVEDEQNNLWIATWGGGLNYFNPRTQEFKQFDIQNNNLISILKEGKSLWITSYGGGLNYFNTETLEVQSFVYDENNESTVSSNNLFSLLKDSRGYLWIGTSGEGINRMNLETQQIERFNTDQNIRYKNITSILEDDEGNIWFGTKDGVIQYDYAKSQFTTFSSLSGDFHINSAFKDDAGFLYFGGIKGILKFNPAQLNTSALQPEVAITNLKIFNKDIEFEKSVILPERDSALNSITLEHFQDVITFEFAALKFPFSNTCEYAIKMENFDEDWRNIDLDRTATFTNLYPGNYTFKVKSRVSGSTWSDDFTAIDVVILKPFWLSWWAMIIYALVFLLFLYIYRKLSISWTQLKNNLAFEKLTHEKDKELYTLKQQFFTNISHEIRTPVTLILSSINRLFDNDKLKDSKQIKAAHTIRRNSNLLLRLVNELLDVRKLETNEIQLKITKNEFVSFVKGIYYSFSEVAKDRRIQYKFKSEINSIELWFDKGQLEKVIFNLISNAFKFTNDDGAIHVTIEDNLDYVSFKVKDDGIGIASDHLKQIFNKFYQVKSDHSSTNRGFGLGLSIVKDITKLHKGEVNVSSEYKKGSLFEIQLLKGYTHFDHNSEDVEVDDLENMENKISKVKSKKIKILVVEDNSEIQDSLKEILEKEGYDVVQAFNGVEGLKKATTEQPNLMISDVMMPEMDGIELSKRMKKNSITSLVPIILLTAKTSANDKIEGFDTGADAYITKPYDEAFLLNRIKNLLKNRKLLKEKLKTNTDLNPKETNINSQDELFLEDLYKLLEENLQSNQLKAVFISKAMNMSHSALYKKIKSLTGLTYMELVRDYKLAIAKQLIQEMGYSVTEACYKVGYSDRKYFSKLFKQKFKKNPSDFSKS